MVSFWPWKDRNSADSFERTLSDLAKKIQKTSANNDALRQRSRKLKVSWTLYGGFTYIIVALIFILVTGWQNWGAMEYSTVAGGPLLLWAVRRLLTLWYDYRISKTQEYLDSLNKERDATIEKLKAATKYNSTQELIDKYSSKPNTPKQDAKGGKRKSGGAPQEEKPPQRQAFIQPPPTANIPRGNTMPMPLQPGPQGRPVSPPGPPPPSYQQGPPSPGAEFAPNAFAEVPPAAPPTYGEATWYDRILDALLGEDETSAKNRFALICSNCKLVNGQAPPGAKTLEDVGRWRCSSCGTMNGVESEATKLVKEVTKSQAAIEESEPLAESGVLVGEEEDDEVEGAGDIGVDDEAAGSPAGSTRSKGKSGKAKKGKK